MKNYQITLTSLMVFCIKELSVLFQLTCQISQPPEKLQNTSIYSCVNTSLSNRVNERTTPKRRL